MSNLDKTKKLPFKPADLIIYGAVLTVILALFLAFVFFSSSAALSTIYVDVDGKEVMRYDYLSGALSVNEQNLRYESLKTDSGLEVTLFFGDEYNKFIIESAGSVKMLEATCSLSHDCTLMSITKSSDVIICVPHKLKIYAEKNYSPTLG